MSVKLNSDVLHLHSGLGSGFGRAADDDVGDSVQSAAPGTFQSFSSILAPQDNAPPVLGGLPVSDTYTENGAPIAIAPALTLTDADSPNITDAIINLGGGRFDDVLGFVNQNGITATYTPQIFQLHLSGTASVADYQAALRSITFSSNSDNPTAQSATRFISFDVTDGTSFSGGSTTINIIAVNDAPTLAGANNTYTYLEEQAPLVLAPSLLVNDPDSFSVTATLTISSGFTTGDLLSYDSTFASGSWNAATHTLTFSGTVSQNLQVALRTVTYSTNNSNPTTADRVIDVTVSDGQYSATQTTTVHVTPENNSPHITIAGNIGNYVEGGAPVVLDDGILVSDSDTAMLVGGSVKVTSGLPSDILHFTDQNGITGHFDAATRTLTLTGTTTSANYQAALRTVTFESPGDYPNQIGHNIVWTVDDGQAVNHAGTATSVVNITAVNDPPVFSGFPTVVYSGAGAPVAPALTIADPDGFNMREMTIAITGGEQAGDILVANFRPDFETNPGISVDADSIFIGGGFHSFATYQDILHSISFASTNGTPAAGARTITISGVDEDLGNATPVSFQLVVGAVTGAPAVGGLGNAVGYTEQAAGVVVAPGLTTADSDSATLTGAVVRISAGAGSGDTLNFTAQNGISGSYSANAHELLLSGSATLADYQTALRSVTFSSASDDPGAGARTVAYALNDGSHIGAFGTSTVNVTPVDDAPVLTGSSSTGFVGEQQSSGQITIFNPLTVVDSDNATLTGATVTISSGYLLGDSLVPGSPQAGITTTWDAASHVLTLSGSASVAAYQGMLNVVSLAVNSDNPTNYGTDTTRTIQFVATDGTLSSAPATYIMQVIGINDPSVLAGAGNTVNYQPLASGAVVDGAITVSDVDNLNLAGATATISGFVTGDALNFTNQNGISGSFDASTHVLTLTGSATLANYQAALRSVTYSSSAADPTAGGAHLGRVIDWQVDDGGNTSNLSNQISSSIHIAGINAAPALGGAGTSQGYTEQAAAVALDIGLTVADSDSTNLAGATVAISSGFVAGDTLNFTNQNGISGSYNAASHVLTLSGASSLANYQAALRAVTFSSASDNPDNFGASHARTITWTADDGQSTNHASASVTTTLNITAVDDLPVAHNDAFAANEQIAIGPTLNLFANNGAGADSDPDNASLVISAVNGSTPSVGHQITLASGAHLTVNADGSFAYDPNGAFDHLAAPGSGSTDTSATDTFTYTINGTVETATVTITGVDSNDTLHGTAGNDTFDGGIDNDTLVFTGNPADYAITYDPVAQAYTVIDQRPGSPDGTDTVRGVENFQFAFTTQSVAVDTHIVDNGDGSRTTTSYDAANDLPWTSQVWATDAQGSLALQTVVTDGGTRWTNSFDTANTQPWTMKTASFDPGNHETTEVVTNDNGSHSLTLFDVANTYSWTSATIGYDANWNVTGVTGTNDDSSHTVAMKDVQAALDTALWFTTPYDANQGLPVDVVLAGGTNVDYFYGGAGNDTLNTGGGNDVLNGGHGDDALIGNGGDDRFVFHFGDGNDQILDFEPGNAHGDVIELHGYGITSFAALQPFLVDVAGVETHIVFDAQNQISLNGVAISSLNAGDFAFI